MVVRTGSPAPTEHAASTEPQGAQALIEEARRNRRRRRRRAATLMLAVVLALAAIAVVTTQLVANGGTARSRPDGATDALRTGAPPDVVGWAGADIVVISTRTGAVVRTLASQVVVSAPGFPDIAVAPDGTVFFDSAGLTTFDTGAWGGGDQIFAVPLTGGPITHVAAGFDPALSPDGHTLAFVSSDPLGEAPYLAAGVGLDIAEVHGSRVTHVRTLAPGPRQLNRGLSQLSWSPDSRSLSFDLLDGSTSVTTFWTLALTPHTASLTAAREIPITRPGLTWNGYLGNGRHGQAVGVGVLTTAGGSQHVVTLSPATGRVIATLFGVPGALCVPVTSSVEPQCAYPFSDPVSGDPSGRDVLVAGVVPVRGATPTPSGMAALYRWSVGDRTPVKLTPQVLRATWGPASPSR
jgi:hypothetical protein